ncbi:hypothetical protein M3Y99_01429900 [Aphelenchoides fujianensis]|nr:hypothetical protein M3Y99_01429900 [Aphelenchoides fujianensis]
MSPPFTLLIFLLLPTTFARVPFAFEDPDADFSRSISCYMGAYYNYENNHMNYETRACNPGIRHCGVILHSKTTNDIPGVVMRMSCEQAAMHCKKNGIVDTAAFVGRCCSTSMCNFK